MNQLESFNQLAREAVRTMALALAIAPAIEAEAKATRHGFIVENFKVADSMLLRAGNAYRALRAKPEELVAFGKILETRGVDAKLRPGLIAFVEGYRELTRNRPTNGNMIGEAYDELAQIAVRELARRVDEALETATNKLPRSTELDAPVWKALASGLASLAEQQPAITSSTPGVGLGA